MKINIIPDYHFTTTPHINRMIKRSFAQGLRGGQYRKSSSKMGKRFVLVVPSN